MTIATHPGPGGGPRPGLAPGPLRAAVVLAQPAKRVLHVRLPGRDHHDLRRAVPRRRRELLLRRASALQYYVPTIAAVSVLGSCYSQLAIVLAMRRQDGILKRVRATPLPAWAYFLGLLAHCIMVSAVDVALITGIGRLFGVPLPSHWAAIAAALVLGAASFCALGVAVASLIRNAEAAPAVVQLVLFPLVFISGTYMPIHSAMLNHIASALPVRPFNQALLGPFAQHTGFDWHNLAVLAAWGAAGALIAIRRFRWNPRPE